MAALLSCARRGVMARVLSGGRSGHEPGGEQGNELHALASAERTLSAIGLHRSRYFLMRRSSRRCGRRPKAAAEWQSCYLITLVERLLADRCERVARERALPPCPWSGPLAVSASA